MILTETVLEKFDPKLSDAVFSSVFQYNLRSEVDNDVISGMTVDNVGSGVSSKFGDFGSNGFHDIRGAGFPFERTNERT